MACLASLPPAPVDAVGVVPLDVLGCLWPGPAWLLCLFVDVDPSRYCGQWLVGPVRPSFSRSGTHLPLMGVGASFASPLLVAYSLPPAAGGDSLVSVSAYASALLICLYGCASPFPCCDARPSSAEPPPPAIIIAGPPGAWPHCASPCLASPLDVVATLYGLWLLTRAFCRDPLALGSGAWALVCVEVLCSWTSRSFHHCCGDVAFVSPLSCRRALPCVRTGGGLYAGQLVWQAAIVWGVLVFHDTLPPGHVKCGLVVSEEPSYLPFPLTLCMLLRYAACGGPSCRPPLCVCRLVCAWLLLVKLC